MNSTLPPGIASQAGVKHRILSWFAKSEKHGPAPETLPDIQLGKDGLLQILSFSAGEFGGIMYLGTIHALLLSKRKPDIIAGISSGAIAATIAAEILTLSEGPPTAAQVARFREFLQMVQQLPDHIWSDLLPHLLELESAAPLEPLQSPVLAEDERAARLNAVRARHGLLLLYNGLLSSRMPLSDLTRITRRALDLPQIGSWQATRVWRWLNANGVYSKWKVTTGRFIDCSGQLALYLWAGIRLWLSLGWPMLRDFELVTNALWAAAFGWRVAAVRKAKAKLNGSASMLVALQSWALYGSREPRSAKGLLFGTWRDRFRKLLVVVKPVVALVAWVCLLPGAPLAFGLSKLPSRVKPAILAVLGGILALCGLGGVIWATDGPQAPTVFIFMTLLLWWLTAGAWKDPKASFLGYFDLRADLATSYAARLLFVKAFDPAYYGKTDLNAMVSAALSGEKSAASPSSPKRKALSDYLYERVEGRLRPRRNPLLILPVAANIGSGQIEAADPRESVVDALCAATALVPIFRAQPLEHSQGPKWDGKTWFIDGSNIAPEPHIPVLNAVKTLSTGEWALRGVTLGDVRKVEILAVAPNPIDHAMRKEREQQWRDTFKPDQMIQAKEEPDAGEHHEELVRSLPKALRLQQLQAAKDERLLLQIYSHALAPFERPIVTLPANNGMPEATFIAASIRAIEPMANPNLAIRLLEARSADAKRELIGETIADGCRITLERLFQDELSSLAAKDPARRHISCAQVLNGVTLPGSRVKDGPGLPEICRFCSLKNSDVPGGAQVRTSLICRAAQMSPPIAASDLDPTPTGGEKIGSSTPPIAGSAAQQGERPGTLSMAEPWVSTVFAGGVFRGVFQVGVLAALSEAGLRPKVMAGASVGTIMSAISAVILGDNGPQSAGNRQARVRSVAATFLAIDRLVLTDRFADFIRRVTLRLGKAHFSLRDTDIMFRRFDRRSWDNFSTASRRVLAGIEQLFFLDPRDLAKLSLASRQRDRKELLDLLRGYVQEFMDRSSIGSELLGAEPLELLIRHHVLNPLGLDLHSSCKFQVFKEKFGIDFLGTVTNLTTGQLDLLSSQAPDFRQPDLLNGLLASSAFPAVFRPRWLWEIRPVAPWELCIDGGVADNLPLVPVARFLYYATQRGLASPAPCDPGQPWSPATSRPHLIFTASLEVTPADLTDPSKAAQLGEIINDWTKLRERAAQLRHNKKVDRFIQFQKDIRQIRAASPLKDSPLTDIHPVCVKPQWLCGTFAFHPMLGFRKSEQAKSIAHGCASTFGQLHIEEERLGQRTSCWWKNLGVNPASITAPSDPARPPMLTPATKTARRGGCWFRNDALCPFSPEAMESAKIAGEAIPPAVFRDLALIYAVCGRKSTHRPRKG